MEEEGGGEEGGGGEGNRMPREVRWKKKRGWRREG